MKLWGFLGPRFQDPRLLGHLVVAIVAVGTIALTYSSASRENSLVRRSLTSYEEYLRRRFDNLFMRANPRHIVLVQAGIAYMLVACAVVQQNANFLIHIPVMAAVPYVYLELKHRRRVAAIEAQTDGFVLALANALKATPSVADAFISMKAVMSEPLKSEIDLAVKQMRLGQTLEDSLLEMARRIHSRVFDTALSSVLIGQRVGGNLPKILETTAAALRELHRLDGVVRTKTASGRIQLWVIALSPIALVVIFDRTQPHYFDPLTSHPMGSMIMAVALVLWVIAVFLGRKILRVDI